MYDAVFTEQLSKPAAVLVNEGFGFDAQSAASGKGMPGVRYVSETVPCECTVPERIASGTRAAVDDLVAALTRPLSTEEVSPSPREADGARGVVFKGDLTEVQQFFYRRGWTDGLPIGPPTEEAVREMLTGTDLPPDHLVGKMMPRQGKVTVEKIAVNAVMAGALPTAMPVLIAAVEALLDPRSMFGTWQVSTGSWSPFWVVNGPIREQLHINSGTGALSPGDLANATIGRAIGLLVKNLGGARKGIEDMGVLGNPGKYTMVIAENEEASPWEPLHVQQGFEAQDSCVTVSAPNSYLQIWPYGSDDKGIMRAITSNMVPRWRRLTLLLPPGHAQTLAEADWTKQEIASYLYEHGHVPAYRTPDYWGTPGVGRLRRPPMNAEDPTPLLNGPDSMRVVVVGGPGTFMGMAYGASGWTTKPIRLPASWDGVVRTYRSLVPKYLRY